MNKYTIFVRRFASNQLDTAVLTITYILVIIYLMFRELVKMSKKICFIVENCNFDACVSP